MQIKAILASFLLAAAVSAKGHNKDKLLNSTTLATASVKNQCAAIDEMSKIIDLANNDTLLEEYAKNNDTKIAKIKAKAANLTSELTSLTSNTTLMGECSVITAHEEAKQACGQMDDLAKDIATAANDTKLEDKFDGNATKISEFKVKAESKATELADMASNSTLTAFCAVQADKSTCKSISKIQEKIAKDTNTTRLNAKFDGNETKIAKQQAKAAKLQTELDALMANTTLMDTCASMNISVAAASTSSDGTTTDDADSPGSRLQTASSAMLVLLGSAMFLL
ncbi:hypothetical protein GGR57DRAFT_230839 [Xylariaceae sp. FL1272]|nr:hypothetical protein GGR57DRAFT_230839 [Xylariaceae sp. FL1272]